MSATDNENRLAALAGKSLGDFKIVAMTEVYRLDIERRTKEATIGSFRDKGVAEAFLDNQRDHREFYGTTPVFVLTDGHVGFIVKPDLVTLFDDEQEVLKIKEAAAAKLSPAERKLLGL